MEKKKRKPDLTHYLQRYSSKLLWHFTGYRKSPKKAFQNLRKIILTQKLIVKDEPVIMNDEQKLTGYPRACLADIPFKDLRMHTRRYKAYGICFHKKRAIQRGHFNPVFYIHRNHPLFKEAHQLFGRIDKILPNNIFFKKGSWQFYLKRHLRMLAAFVKLGYLDKPVENNYRLDKEQKNNFYYEREWRSPSVWKFKEGDVHSIMVPKKDLKKMKEFFKKLNERKKLSEAFKKVPIISSDMIEEL